MRYLLVGDIHLADRPPASCTSSYLDDLFDLLDQTVQMETLLDCDATVWAGDVFHIKAASRNSHRMVQRVIAMAKRYKRLYIVPGNHDMEHDRIDSLSKQPLGTLFKSGAAQPLVGQSPDDPDLWGVPWQQDWTGFEPPVLRPEQLAVAHAPLYPTGIRPPHDEFVSAHWWATAQECGYVYYGHVHELHGVYRESGPDFDVTFCNQGALTRGSLAEHDVLREVAVTTWDDGTGFVRRELDFKPASQVYRMVEVGETRQAKLRVDQFVESVGATQVVRVTRASVLEAAQAKGLSDQVRNKIQSLLEFAETA